MSRKGNPSSGIIRRSQLRPRTSRLTPLELRASLLVDRADGIEVEALGVQLGVPQAVAYRIALALVEKNRASVRHGALWGSQSGRGPS